jgi:hypothetical protein
MEKIIHQTWKDYDIPRNIYRESWQDSWKNMSPDWEYKFWTDEDNERLVRDDYPMFWDIFQKVKKGVIKSDLCRLLYLHKHGGIYADMDFICLKDMDALLTPLGDHIVLGKHNNSGQPLPNAWMYSPKGDTFWLAMAFDAFNDLAKKVSRSTEQVAGPDRLNWAVDVHKPNHTLLSHDLIYPRAWGDPECDRVARSIDWECVDLLKEAYPKSYAVTYWTHNW